MAQADEDIAVAPIDLAIERIRRVYRGWNRNTSVAQMRSDWDAAFESRTAPVTCERVSAGGVDGEWIRANAPRRTRPSSISTAAAFASARWPRTAT